METILFDWDPNKNLLNVQKHGISFEDARDVFYDDEAILFDDPDHSDSEERFLILGRARDSNVLIVSHCYRSQDQIIRIISARKATKKEEAFYYFH